MDTIIVVDFNKVFSALLKPSRIRETLLSGQHRFAAPDFTLAELFKHFPRIQQLSEHNHDELMDLVGRFMKVMQLYAPNEVSLENRQIAYHLCHDIDPDDTPYVALTLELNGKLWSGDKKLREGLLAKGVDIFVDL